MSGTDLLYGPQRGGVVSTWCVAPMLSFYAPPTPCPVLTCAIILRDPYAMSSTDIRYSPTRSLRHVRY
eukprot:1716409-Rhodomonas_salina.1